MAGSLVVKRRALDPDSGGSNPSPPETKSMKQYFIYKITFDVSINNAQKDALNILDNHLPSQIIVNTSIPISKQFALGEEIGLELEVESEDEFDINTLNIAITLSNEDLGSNVIRSITPIGTNILNEDGEGVLTDLVDLSL